MNVLDTYQTQTTLLYWIRENIGGLHVQRGSERYHEQLANITHTREQLDQFEQLVNDERNARKRVSDESTAGWSDESARPVERESLIDIINESFATAAHAERDEFTADFSDAGFAESLSLIAREPHANGLVYDCDCDCDCYECDDITGSYPASECECDCDCIDCDTDTYTS